MQAIRRHGRSSKPAPSSIARELGTRGLIGRRAGSGATPRASHPGGSAGDGGRRLGAAADKVPEADYRPTRSDPGHHDAAAGQLPTASAEHKPSPTPARLPGRSPERR
jgi:hypothetical protein